MSESDRKSVARAFFNQVTDVTDKFDAFKDGDDTSDEQ